MAADEGGGAAELRDSRFSYLLQPIRDLAANWDINIAGELEEYLEELESLTFALEGCAGPGLNFAEAALLIQGTTSVFSKKVEYLHNLVYQALETIFSRKQKEKQAASRQRANIQSDGGDDAVGSHDFFDPAAHLVLAASADIDLAEEDDDAARPVALRPPTALLALEDAACGQGSTQGGAQGNASNYRLAQCSVHESGALLLEARDGELFDAMLRPRTPAVAAQAPASVAVAAVPGLEPALIEAPAGADASPGLLMDGEAFADDAHGCADDDDRPAGGYALNDGDADDDQHAAVLQPLETSTTLPPWLEQASSVEAGLPEPTASASAGSAEPRAEEGGMHAGKHASSHGSQPSRSNTARPTQGHFYDPYEPLDPNVPGTLPLKPLQVRKPRRRTAARAAASDGAAGVACLNTIREPGLHWPELGYLLARVTAAAASAGKGARGRGDSERAQDAAGHLQPLAPQLAAVMDWQDAAAAAEREAQTLQYGEDDACEDGGGSFDEPGGEDDWAPVPASGPEDAGEANLQK